MKNFFEASFRFCPHCGAPWGAANPSTPNQKHCSQCNFLYYYNSSPTVTAVVLAENTILLGKRRFAPAAGLLDLVGGFIKVGERAEEALIRECQEETGLAGEVLRYLDSFADEYGENGQATLNFFYEVRLQGEAVGSDDIADLRYYAIPELQLEDFAFENARQFIKNLQEGKYDR